MSAVFKKEFRSYFTSPIGYFVLAIMFCFAGLNFFLSNMVGGLTTLHYVYMNIYTIVMLLVLPVLTMRLFSDEKRQKTDQALFTAPTSITSVVLGKFFAALLLFVLGLSITLVYAVIIATQVNPGWLVIFGNLLGFTLLGGTIIAIGMLISCLTESQFIAALSTFGISFLLVSLDSITAAFGNAKWITTIVSFLSVNVRFSNFTTGLIKYDDLIFFLSMQAMFMFIAIRVLDRKRWN